jgi:hypothetical protein
VYVFSLAINGVTLLRTDLASLYDSGDPKLMAGFISSLVLRQILGASIGLVGVLVAWIAIRRSDPPPSWFLSASGLFGFAWVFFFPIGTVVAAYMLEWRINVIRSQRVK